MRKILVMIPAGETYDHDCVRWYRAHDVQRSIDHYHNIGDAFVHDEVGYRFVDPRVSRSLPQGSYSMVWLGPAKGGRPFASDLQVEVRSQPQGATWRPPRSEWVVPTGKAYEDLARSPLGVIEVDRRSTVAVTLNPSVPTEGRPRLRIPVGVEPAAPTRATTLAMLGGGSLLLGMAAIGRGRKSSRGHQMAGRP